MSKEKVCVRLEEELLCNLKGKYNTENQSEAIRMAMLCYLPWNVKVVANDINGELTNLYLVIRDNPSAFVHEVWKLPYSEVLFQQFIEEMDHRKEMSSMERAFNVVNLSCYNHEKYFYLLKF